MMSESLRPQSPEPTQPNLGDLVEDALHQAKALVQAELSIARRELTSEVASTFDSLVWLALGALFAQAALTTLGVLAVLALGVGLASAGVIVLLAGVSAALFNVGIRALKRRSLAPVTARLAMDAKQVLETVK